MEDKVEELDGGESSEFRGGAVISLSIPRNKIAKVGEDLKYSFERLFKRCQVLIWYNFVSPWELIKCPRKEIGQTGSESDS
jgi:hypothetical protein